MDRETREYHQGAIEARLAYDTAVGTHAQAVFRRMELEAEKPREKDATIRRIMDEQKLAFTPAERLAESDDNYAAFLKEYREAVRVEALAFGALMSEKMRHQEACTLLAISGNEMVRLEEVGR